MKAFHLYATLFGVLSYKLTEKNSLEESFSKGEGDIAALSLRYNEVKNRLDEAELRWLELSEKA